MLRGGREGAEGAETVSDAEVTWGRGHRLRWVGRRVMAVIAGDRKGAGMIAQKDLGEMMVWREPDRGRVMAWGVAMVG